jgi:hypothetical protein
MNSQFKNKADLAFFDLPFPRRLPNTGTCA